MGSALRRWGDEVLPEHYEGYHILVKHNGLKGRRCAPAAAIAASRCRSGRCRCRCRKAIGVVVAAATAAAAGPSPSGSGRRWQSVFEQP